MLRWIIAILASLVLSANFVEANHDRTNVHLLPGRINVYTNGEQIWNGNIAFDGNIPVARGNEVVSCAADWPGDRRACHLFIDANLSGWPLSPFGLILIP